MAPYFFPPAGQVITAYGVDYAGNSQTGYYGMWRGNLCGRAVYLQGSPVTDANGPGTLWEGYDIYEDANPDTGAEKIKYWGSFRGNVYNAAVPNNYSSTTGNNFVLWMKGSMTITNPTTLITTSTVGKNMDNQNRQAVAGASGSEAVELVAYYQYYQIPEIAAGNTYPGGGPTGYANVLQFNFYSDASTPVTMAATKESYWYALGVGQIRYVSAQQHDPSSKTNYSTHKGWAVHVDQTATQGGAVNGTIHGPDISWYDPFPTPDSFSAVDDYTTFVPNGYFQYPLPNKSLSDGALVSACLNDWTASSNDCLVVASSKLPAGISGYADNPNYLSPWAICLKGSASGGSGAADSITTTSYIPVEPSATYALSAWIFRNSSSDNVYVDYDDGQGAGQNFTDANAGTNASGEWQLVTGYATMGAATTGIKVRFVRDGGNVGNAYISYISLQRTN